MLAEIKWLLPLILVVALTGCFDPYKENLPATGTLTPAQTQKIVEKLPHADRAIFQRWTQRRLLGHSFGGEPSAPTVQDAIRNQAEFEARQSRERAQADELAKDEAAKVQAAQLEAAKLHAAHLAAEQHAKIVDIEARRYLKIEGLSHFIQPLYNNQNEEIGRSWVLQLRLTNLSTKEIIGTSGMVALNDPFGRGIGTYSLAIEPRIAVGKSIVYNASMRIDGKDSGHIALMQTKTIFPQWRIESVAFFDGSRIDGATVPVK